MVGRVLTSRQRQPANRALSRGDGVGAELTRRHLVLLAFLMTLVQTLGCEHRPARVPASGPAPASKRVAATRPSVLAEGLQGHWEGEVLRKDQAEPFQIDLTVEGPILRGTINLRRWNSPNVAAMTGTVNGGQFELKVVPNDSRPPAFSFTGELTDTSIRGQCDLRTGESARFWLRRQRLESAHGPPRPQTPLPPFPYGSEEVVFQVGNIVRAGTVTFPVGGGLHPAVFLIQGGNGNDRNETGDYHQPFLVLADALTRAGVVVLRADSRGFGHSTGKDEETTLDEHVADVAAAVRLLRNRSDVAKRGVGVIGVSRGGVIAAVAASRLKAIDFVVLLSTPVRNWADIAFDVWLAAPPDGFRDPETIQLMKRIQPLLAKALLEQARSPDREPLPDDRLRAILGPDAALVPSIRPIVDAQNEPVKRSFYQYDPTAVYPRIHGRVFALFGADDAVLKDPPRQAETLRELLPKAANRKKDVLVMPQLTHALRASTARMPGQSHETWNPAALKTIVNWVSTVTKS
jgi:pimeloyl-ACP methyl ester carboxylesterase